MQVVSTPPISPASGPRQSTAGHGASASRRYPHSFWWYVKWFFNILALVLFCLFFIVFAIGKLIYDDLSKTVLNTNYITTHDHPTATKVYASDGTVLAEFKDDQHQYVPISDLQIRLKTGWMMPGNLINATLSIEDSRFYTHPGMDPKRILGAAWSNLRHGGSGQGGSTITEQLAVNIYLKRTKTFARRLQTALLALQLERHYSKDEILGMYLNEIYYGNRAYGCETAAQLYFGKHARDLTVAEAALMAGLPQQPSRLDPFLHLDRAQRRQALVLHEMFIDKKITYAQYGDALNDTSVAQEISGGPARAARRHQQKQIWQAPYFVAYVKQYLEKQYGWTDEFLDQGGLKIYTTLDPRIQERAETCVHEKLDELSGTGQLQAALVCIDPWTGHVLAMVGGRDYYDTRNNGQWNRAVQARRQPGSTFKAYVYATAMEAGYTPDSIVNDEPLSVCGVTICDRPGQRGAHEIKNDDFRHRGRITLEEAIGISDNVAATKTLLKVGIENVIQKAHLMGIQSELEPYPTLALGTSGVTLLEHTSAYGVFATRGLRAEQTPVDRVDNDAGETLMEHTHPVHGSRVLSSDAADKMWDMLRYVVTSGTGRSAQIDGVDVIGKTGTTSSNKDVWFMGATKDLVCGVWMGYDHPRELYGSSGGGWCGPLWRHFMVGALDIWSHRHPVDKLVEDDRATEARNMAAAQYKKTVRLRICDESGLLANAGCPKTHIVEYAVGSADIPKRHCDIHMNSQDAANAQNGGDGSSQLQPGDLGYNPDGVDDSGQPGRHDNIDDDGDRPRHRRKHHAAAGSPPPAEGGAAAAQGGDSNAGEGQVDGESDGGQAGAADNGGGDALARHSNTAFRPLASSRYNHHSA